MGGVWVALSLCLTNIIADILCYVITKSWMLDSGVLYLSDYQLLCIKFSIYSFMIIALLFEIIYITDHILFVYLTMIWAGINIFFYLMIGGQWIFDPTNAFTNLYASWKANINKPTTTFIENHFRCCGFYSVKEFPMDICKASVERACFHTISRTFKRNVQFTGIFAILHVTSDFVIITLLYISVFRNKRRMLPKKLRKSKEKDLSIFLPNRSTMM